MHLSELFYAILAFFKRSPARSPAPPPAIDAAHIAPAPTPLIAPMVPTPLTPPALVAKPEVASQAPITTPAGFIATIGPAARISMAKTKIPASFTVAEAALESGWGAHCPGHNLFGIKADLSWTGMSTMQMTHEVIDGKTETVAAKFRAYPDWLSSIEDHARFLIDNPRYKQAFAFTDGEKFASAVAKSGYATDPQYAAKICSIIDAHHLLQLDTETA